MTNYLRLVCWGVSIVLVLLAILSVWFSINVIHIGPMYFCGTLNSVLGTLISLYAFLFFLKLKIGYNKYINMVGGATFGILLIHSNCAEMRQFIYHDIFNNQQHFLNGEWWIAIPATLCIFTICALIEIIRQKYIECKILTLLYKVLCVK